MTRVVLRATPVALLSTVKFTVAFPEPVLFTMCTHVEGADAVQLQPVLATMSTLPLPPADGWTGLLLPMMLKLHGTPA